MSKNTLASDAWVLVEDDEGFKGVVLMVDPASGEAVSLSCRNRRDVDRWTIMPSLSRYPSLTSLDLHKCRYLKDLDDSIGQLSNLRRLCLTQCERLVRLPETIGQLRNLQEVRSFCAASYCVHISLLLDSPHLLSWT